LILPLIEKIAQHAADALEHAAWRPRILLVRWFQHLLFAETWRDFARSRPSRPPAWGGGLRPGAALPVAGGWWLLPGVWWLVAGGFSSHDRPATSPVKR